MSSGKPFLETLAGRIQPVPPLWLMRQAGRYLPEYRELRKQAGSFQAMIGNPEIACEITLQPLRRFAFDAAILFSDILTIPAALGQGLAFEDGRGPVLAPFPGLEALDRTRLHHRLSPVYETLSLLKSALPAEGFDRTALIGFAGAPWTIACYMIEGMGSKDFAAARSLAYADPETFTRLIALLTEVTADYLSRQIEAGAEAVQLFDSWAGVLPDAQFERWVIEPARQIARILKDRHPQVPLIGFPRGAGGMLGAYARGSGVTVLGLDERADLAQARSLGLPLQGNLDPFVLRAGGAVLDVHVDAVLSALEGHPFVFNLGHGVNKDTPVAHVERLVNRVRLQERM